MKTRNSSGYLRTIAINLVLSVMLALPWNAFAQDEITLRYHEVEDPGERLISSQNLLLAIAFAFDSERFRKLWPQYGYPYFDFLSSCSSPNLQRYDIGSGALAIPSTDANSEHAEYIGLALADNTSREDVESFIGAVANGTGGVPASQAPNAERVREEDGEHEVVRMHEICRILPRPDTESTDSRYTGLVVITQHPIPGSFTDLRLTELDTMPR